MRLEGIIIRISVISISIIIIIIIICQRDKLKNLASVASKHQISNIGVQGDSFAMVREEELAEMEYEDERRRIVIEQSSLLRLNGQSSSSSSSQQQQELSSSKQMPRESISKQVGASQKSIEVTAMDINTAYKFLSVTRQLTMADRTKKSYYWVVVREESNGVMLYTLQWREESHEYAQVTGSVFLGDIESVSYSDPSLVVLTLSNSIKVNCYHHYYYFIFIIIIIIIIRH